MIPASFAHAVEAMTAVVGEFQKSKSIPLQRVNALLAGWECTDDSEDDWCFTSQGLTVWFDSPFRIYVEYRFDHDTPTVSGAYEGRTYHTIRWLSSLRNEDGLVFVDVRGYPPEGDVLAQELGFCVSHDEALYDRLIKDSQALDDCKLDYVHSSMDLMLLSK